MAGELVDLCIKFLDNAARRGSPAVVDHDVEEPDPCR